MILSEARDYLRRRHIREELWSEAGIGACIRGYAAGRVVVPVTAPDGTWFGWVGRAWGKSSLPYIYPKGMRRGHLLYNHDALLVETDEPVFVVEGVFDALALWPNAVAVLGMPTRQHLAALKLSKRPVVSLLDGDARRQGHALALQLRVARVRSGAIILPPLTDPDEVSVELLQEAAREALSASSARFEISPT
jgi:DNA primase